MEPGGPLVAVFSSSGLHGCAPCMAWVPCIRTLFTLSVFLLWLPVYVIVELCLVALFINETF